MKRSSLYLALLIPILAAAQLAPIRSGVFRWRDTSAKQTDGRTERAILSGTTMDLASLDIRAVTLAPKRATDTAIVVGENASEVLLIVKDGQLGITIDGKQKLVSSGSVALALPGDHILVINEGAKPATYYLFTYVSKAPPDVARGKIAGGSFLVDWSEVEAKKNATGMRRDIFDRPTSMFRRFEMHVSTLNEGLTNHAVHTHRAEEFVLMREGSIEMVIDTPGHPLTAGDIGFLASNIPHSARNTGAGPTEYFAFQGQ
ncbi:MAG: cupin [Gemmatimonadetes bacterium]|nr:cupin [Gemmatimonadota bacterium]